MRALIIVDVQNDFCEGGALAVPGGGAVAGAITRYLHTADGHDAPRYDVPRYDVPRYDYVVATKDAHIDPGDHFSDDPDYVSSWPPHCIAGSAGADFHPDLDATRIDAVFHKGAHTAGLSGFEGIDDTGTALGDWLRQRGVDSVDVVGIATDYCVYRTAEDAAAAGFSTTVLPDLTAGVATESTAAALAALRGAGIALGKSA